MTKEGLLSVEDVSRILKVSRRTLYNWIRQGILEPIRIGKLYRFHPDDIDTLIQEGRKAPVKGKASEEVSDKVAILAIDDDLLVRKSLKILLEKSGFEVDSVASGEEALSMMKTKKYDLVLTDVRMPGMDGVETLKALRAIRGEKGQPRIPEIVISAYNDTPSRSELEKLGVKKILTKPFEWDDFLSTVQQSLN